MNPWRVCTFYTVDTGYELEVKKLKRSLERFNIPAHIRGVSSLGSWPWQLAKKYDVQSQVYRSDDG